MKLTRQQHVDRIKRAIDRMDEIHLMGESGHFDIDPKLEEVVTQELSDLLDQFYESIAKLHHHSPEVLETLRGYGKYHHIPCDCSVIKL